MLTIISSIVIFPETIHHPTKLVLFFPHFLHVFYASTICLLHSAGDALMFSPVFTLLTAIGPSKKRLHSLISVVDVKLTALSQLLMSGYVSAEKQLVAVCLAERTFTSFFLYLSFNKVTLKIAPFVSRIKMFCSFTHGVMINCIAVFLAQNVK